MLGNDRTEIFSLAICGAIWAIGSIVPTTIFMTITIGFPIAFVGIARGMQVIPAAFQTLLFVGFYGQGFVVVAVCGSGIGTIVSKSTEGQLTRKKRLTRIFSAGLTVGLLLLVYICSLLGN